MRGSSLLAGAVSDGEGPHKSQYRQEPELPVSERRSRSPEEKCFQHATTASDLAKSVHWDTAHALRRASREKRKSKACESPLFLSRSEELKLASPTLGAKYNDAGSYLSGTSTCKGESDLAWDLECAINDNKTQDVEYRTSQFFEYETDKPMMLHLETRAPDEWEAFERARLRTSLRLLYLLDGLSLELRRKLREKCQETTRMYHIIRETAEAATQAPKAMRHAVFISKPLRMFSSDTEEQERQRSQKLLAPTSPVTTAQPCSPSCKSEVTPFTPGPPENSPLDACSPEKLTEKPSYELSAVTLVKSEDCKATASPTSRKLTLFEFLHLEQEAASQYGQAVLVHVVPASQYSYASKLLIDTLNDQSSHVKREVKETTKQWREFFKAIHDAGPSTTLDPWLAQAQYFDAVTECRLKERDYVATMCHTLAELMELEDWRRSTESELLKKWVNLMETRGTTCMEALSQLQRSLCVTHPRHSRPRGLSDFFKLHARRTDLEGFPVTPSSLKYMTENYSINSATPPVDTNSISPRWQIVNGQTVLADASQQRTSSARRWASFDCLSNAAQTTPSVRSTTVLPQTPPAPLHHRAALYLATPSSQIPIAAGTTPSSSAGTPLSHMDDSGYLETTVSTATVKGVMPQESTEGDAECLSAQDARLARRIEKRTALFAIAAWVTGRPPLKTHDTLPSTMPKISMPFIVRVVAMVADPLHLPPFFHTDITPERVERLTGPFRLTQGSLQEESSWRHVELILTQGHYLHTLRIDSPPSLCSRRVVFSIPLATVEMVFVVDGPRTRKNVLIIRLRNDKAAQRLVSSMLYRKVPEAPRTVVFRFASADAASYWRSAIRRSIAEVTDPEPSLFHFDSPQGTASPSSPDDTTQKDGGGKRSLFKFLKT